MHSFTQTTFPARLIGACWLITKFSCIPLWLADRAFPLVPVLAVFDKLPASIHLILLVVAGLLMLLLVLKPSKKLAAAIVVLEILSCIMDQNRWQPYEYQFIFMLAAFAFLKDDKRIISCWQIILIGLYFFSGLGKLNSAFIHDTWNQFMLRQWLGITGPNVSLSRAGYLIPIIEICAAILLCFHKTRKLSVFILVAMHGLILLMLGPLGLTIAYVIWPWNILMPFLLYALFYRQGLEKQQVVQFYPFNILVLICWWILPWGMQWGYWDRYLSLSMYSGGVEQLIICTNNPEAIARFGYAIVPPYSAIPCRPLLSATKWGVHVMNTAPYPEPRVYKIIARKFNSLYPGDNHFYLIRSGFSYKVETLVPGDQ